MKRGNAEKEVNETKKWKFWKSLLPSIVWDKDGDRPLADFTDDGDRGCDDKFCFVTDDPRVADILKSNGYPEIPLDANRPPDIIVQQPGHSLHTFEEDTEQGKLQAQRDHQAKKEHLSGKPKAPEVIK